MESFEITFFSRKNADILDNIDVFKTNFDNIIRINNKVEVDVFDDEETDFLEIRFSIYNLSLHKDEFLQFIKSVGEYVDSIFIYFDVDFIVTCIYELTFYYIEKILNFSDFDDDVLKKFPFVFVKKSDAEHSDILFEYSKTLCLYNPDAQDIFVI